MTRTLFRRAGRPGSSEPVDPVPPEAERSRSAPKPVARFSPGAVASARQRNLGWLLGGVLVVLVCALAAVLLMTSGDDRVDVVVAAADLERGRPVERSDLRVVRVQVGSGVATVSPTVAAELIGRVPLGEIPQGSLLAAGMFSETEVLAAGEVLVGAALDPGEAPLSTIEPGTAVKLLYSPPTPAGEQPSAPSSEVLGAGTVWATETLGTGQIWLTVRMENSVGLAVSQAAQDDALRVVLSGGDG